MTNQEYVQELVQKAKAAQKVYASFTQEQLNKASRAAAKCVFDNAELLATEAYEETKMGTIPGKTFKMRSAMMMQWFYTKDRPSTGVVGWEKGKLDVDCILKIAKPAGIIGAVMPTTNPTTTMGSNAMQALKGGNAIIVCPHPRAKHVSVHCCNMIRDAIAVTGAPADLVQCVEEPSIDLTNEVMRQVDLVVATGGPGMVKAANSSGNPSLGVGQGNVQAIIDRGMSYRFDEIAEGIMQNRSFDSGIPCSCIQTILIPAEDKDSFVAAINRNHGLYINDKTAIQKFREHIFNINAETGVATTNADCVGVNIQHLSKECGIDLYDEALAVVVEIDKYGKDELLCREKMLPICCLYAYDGSWEDAVAIAKTNLLMEGAGHSSSIYSDDKEHQLHAGLEIPVCRLPVNGGQGMIASRPYYAGGMPATNGIGCGYWQKNMLSENLTFEHMLNYTRMLYTVYTDRPDPTEAEVWAE